jgi:uncharacterized protein (DUF1778 family)
MPTPATKSKTERLEARIPGDAKAILTKAAALQGRSLTDFVVGSALDAARRVIRESEILELSERDQTAFAEALLSPPRAARALRAAARRYRGPHG